MPEETTNQPAPAAVTTDQINEMISSALAGHATKYEKQINKMYESFNGEVKKLATPKPAEQTTIDGTPQQAADPKFAALERTIAELTQKHSAAEQKAMKAEQRQALADAFGTYSFASDKARDVAFKTFESEMQRSDDGKYYIGDRDVKTAVADGMKDLPGLLAPKHVGGSGAVGTQESSKSNLNTLIKSQMTKDEIKQAYALFGQMNLGQ
jgi:hypothetical protein